MALLVFNDRHAVVADHAVIGCIVRTCADPACKLRVIGIDTGVDHGNGYTGAPRIGPGILQIDVIQVVLLGIQFVCHYKGRPGADQRLVIGVHRLGADIIIQRHSRQVCLIFLVLIYVFCTHTLRKIQHGVAAILCDTQPGLQKLCQSLGLSRCCVRQDDGLCVVQALSRLNFLLFLRNDLLLAGVLDTHDRANHRNSCKQRNGN